MFREWKRMKDISAMMFLSFFPALVCVQEDRDIKTLMSEEPGMETGWIDAHAPTKCTDNSSHPLTTPSF